MKTLIELIITIAGISLITFGVSVTAVVILFETQNIPAWIFTSVVWSFVILVLSLIVKRKLI